MLLISPFVGRILDWHIKNGKDNHFTSDKEPGVLLVKHIFNYYKNFGYKTEIMAASFRNIGEILELSGCDLMTIKSANEHPHSLSDKDFDLLFTQDKPVIFAFHGYPWVIHRLTYRRTNHNNFHVRGYKKEGTTTNSL